MQSIQLVYGYQQGQETIQDIAGTPSSVCIQGLQSATSYRLQAVLFNDGVELAQSNIASFVTLGASAITLTLHNISRENYNYRVHYLFSSTYTLSSAVLSCNGQTFQGTVSGNTITFVVTGLTAGDAYLYNVVATDVYGFQETVTGSISTTVINQVNIYYASRSEDSVTFDLVYLHDYTFVSGWIDVWNSSQDPSTDQSISYDMWADGDSSVTATGLTYETTYKFRAAMTVVDAFGTQTTVYSSVLTQTTADHDYSRDCLSIINEYNGENTLVLTARTTGSSVTTNTFSYSTDGGNTWITTTDTAAGRRIAIPAGGKVMLRHSGTMYYYDVSSSRYHTIECTQPFSVAGNPLSLIYGSDYLGENKFVMDWGLAYVFSNATTLVSAAKLNMDISFFEDRYGQTIEHKHCCYFMFQHCTSLVNTPDLPQTKLATSCYAEMFAGCTALRNVPILPATEIAVGSYFGMFSGCSSLTEGADLTKVTKLGTNGITEMYYRCSSLEKAYAPTVDFSDTYNSTDWLKNVAANGTLLADASIAATIPTDNASGCPSGWTVEIVS